MSTSDEKKKKAAAIAVSAAMLAGGVAATDMNSDDNAYLAALNPKPVVQMIDDQTDVQVVQDDDSQKKVQQNQRSQTIAKAVLAPFYAAGVAIMKVGEILLTGVLSPVIAVIINWLIMAGIVLGVLAACLKIAFPNIPLRKMLTKKGIIFVLIVTAVFSAACGIVPAIWPEAALWFFIIKAAGALALILMIFATVMKVLGRRKAEPAAA